MFSTMPAAEVVEAARDSLMIGILPQCLLFVESPARLHSVRFPALLLGDVIRAVDTRFFGYLGSRMTTTALPPALGM
jgi:hypothetical protein